MGGVTLREAGVKQGAWGEASAAGDRIKEMGYLVWQLGGKEKQTEISQVR